MTPSNLYHSDLCFVILRNLTLTYVPVEGPTHSSISGVRTKLPDDNDRPLRIKIETRTQNVHFTLPCYLIPVFESLLRVVRTFGKEPRGKR